MFSKYLKSEYVSQLVDECFGAWALIVCLGYDNINAVELRENLLKRITVDGVRFATEHCLLKEAITGTLSEDGDISILDEFRAYYGIRTMFE